jgi:uncharacterized ferritin-like protein (DUF455 family)
VINLYAIAADCLFDDDIGRKLELTHQAHRAANEQALSFMDDGEVRSIEETLFPAKPRLLMPRDMPRRRLDTDEGRAAFFHALAHIEFVAIYLAWDIIYRFRGLPEAFYRDWLRIADEEAQHFALLCGHLRNFGVDYGDFPAHRGLWLHAVDTADDLLARLAVVPRCLEARGLDVTPAMIEKLRSIGDLHGTAILTRIYQDEIGHVERGSHWFKTIAEQRGLEPKQAYRHAITQCYPAKPKGPFNREARIIAGFTPDEIDWLETHEHE